MMGGQIIQPARSGLILPPGLIRPDRYDAIMPGVLGGVAAGPRFAAGPGPGGGLQDEIPSTCFHLDATDAASYPGSGQTWANLIASPADGSGKTDYDVWLGATSSSSTDDPTFNGTAGDAAAFFSVDGGDFFKSKGNNPAMLNSFHKGDPVWIAVAWRRGATGTSNGGSIFTTRAGSANNAQFVGTDCYMQGSTVAYAIAFRVFNASSNLVFNQNIIPSGSPTTDSLLVLSWRRSGGTNTIRAWYNSRTANTTTPSGTPVTNNTAAGFGLAALDHAGNSKHVNGGRFYAFAGGNAFLDNTEAGKIFDFFNTKHGRIYA